MKQAQQEQAELPVESIIMYMQAVNHPDLAKVLFRVNLLTLGAHAQRGLQYLVCLSVYDYSRTAGNEAASERY